MDKEHFDELVHSIREAGAIMRGEMEPSRVFYVPSTPRSEPQSAFAICIETDDPALLVPRKIYEVELCGDRFVVTDESGEAAVYPSGFLVVIELPVEIQEAFRHRESAVEETPV